MGKQLMDQGCGERGIWRANGLTKQGGGAPHRRARAQAGPPLGSSVLADERNQKGAVLP